MASIITGTCRACYLHAPLERPQFSGDFRSWCCNRMHYVQHDCGEETCWDYIVEIEGEE